jgi:hypothetical protein
MCRLRKRKGAKAPGGEFALIKAGQKKRFTAEDAEDAEGDRA